LSEEETWYKARAACAGKQLIIHKRSERSPAFRCRCQAPRASAQM